MKRLITILTVLAVIGVTAISAKADVSVRGYYRNNGTYVQPHYRSNPDGNPHNNWSTYPNINPYTGERGTKRFGIMRNSNISSYEKPSTLLYCSPGISGYDSSMSKPSPLAGSTLPSGGFGQGSMLTN